MHAAGAAGAGNGLMLGPGEYHAPAGDARGVHSVAQQSWGQGPPCRRRRQMGAAMSRLPAAIFLASSRWCRKPPATALADAPPQRAGKVGRRTPSWRRLMRHERPAMSPDARQARLLSSGRARAKLDYWVIAARRSCERNRNTTHILAARTPTSSALIAHARRLLNTRRLDECARRRARPILPYLPASRTPHDTIPRARRSSFT